MMTATRTRLASNETRRTPPMTRTTDTSDGFPRQHPGQLTTNRTAPAHRGPSHRPRHADTVLGTS